MDKEIDMKLRMLIAAAAWICRSHKRKPLSCSKGIRCSVVAFTLVRDEAEDNGDDKADDHPQRHDPVDYVHSTSSLIHSPTQAVFELGDPPIPKRHGQGAARNPNLSGV